MAKKDNSNSIPNERNKFVAKLSIACYGGPYDGRYYDKDKPPIGYRSFEVRSRTIWLWNAIKVERLDFNILYRASRILPSAFDEPIEDTELDSGGQ